MPACSISHSTTLGGRRSSGKNYPKHFVSITDYTFVEYISKQMM